MYGLNIGNFPIIFGTLPVFSESKKIIFKLGATTSLVSFSIQGTIRTTSFIYIELISIPAVELATLSMVGLCTLFGKSSKISLVKTDLK